MKIKYLPIRTKYWKPWSSNDFEKIIESLSHRLSDDDILVFSEKALSTAAGNLIDESSIMPGILAKILARIWMRIVWGYFLAPLARLNRLNTFRLRSYPIHEGAKHKDLVLRKAGFFNSLKHWSEGGIDANNLPYHFVGLPLRNPAELSFKLRLLVEKKFRKNVTVIIADSDKTFSWGHLHITSRPTQIKGIHNLGPFAFILGRLLKMKARSTPLSVSTHEKFTVDQILNFASLANQARGTGAGRTIWDTADLFKTNITGITWKMLGRIPHYPIVLIRIFPHDSSRSYSSKNSD